MTQAQYLDTADGRALAYHFTEGDGPCIVFLGGLKSDMQGTKAMHLEAWAQSTGRCYLRFDYSGHGLSSGVFDEGAIGDWHRDTLSVVDMLTNGQIVPVGSSMGGWQALLLARARPDRIGGLVTIAAAPDFTQEAWWSGFTDAQKATLKAQGRVELPSDYMEPYVVTRRMIDDGRDNLVLRDPLHLPFPTRFLQGTTDTAVTLETAVRLLDHATGPDIRLTLVKGADHRFSDVRCLRLIEAALAEVLDP